MLNKILTVTTFILLIWLSNEFLKVKKTNVYLKNQLELIQYKLVNLTSDNKKHTQDIQGLLNQILKQQAAILKKEKSYKKQVSAKNKTKNQDNTKKSDMKKEDDKKKQATKSLDSALAQHLSGVDKEINDKKLQGASKKLSEVKKILWKERNNKNLSKDKLLSILSSIDLLQQKLKKGKHKGKDAYTTSIIKKKIAALNIKGGSKNGK